MVITKDMKFYKCFRDNLEFLNYRVILFRSSSSFMHNKMNYLKLIFSILIYNSKKTKALIIRPDLFDVKFLKKITEKIPKNYAYQWDGLSRYSEVTSLINSFNKFFVFDHNDILNYENVYKLNNFYFDCYSDIKKTTEIEYDVYYVGSYDSRINQLIDVCEILYKLGFKLNIKIPCNGKEAALLKKYSYINTNRNNRTYKENLINVFKSKVLLDFSHKNLHQGLSFRVYEAIGYSKKIITTNNLVVNYDFFNKKNIFLYNEKSTAQELKSFILNDFVDLGKTLKEKYSFINWIKNFD